MIATFHEMQQYISKGVANNCALGELAAVDADQLICLERKLFPEAPGLFDQPCVTRALDYFRQSIIVGKERGEIQSYCSFFPLSKEGMAFTIENNINSFCRFPSLAFPIKSNPISAIYVEVIAVAPDCPHVVKYQTLSFSYSFLRHFDLPLLSCPVSNAGLRLVKKYRFHPVSHAGLQALYVRLPR